MFESNIKLNLLAKVIDCEHKTAPTVDEGFPLIRTPDIDRGRLKSHQARRVTEKTFTQWTRRAIPEPGDLIMAREAPVGNVGIVRKGEKVCLGQRTVLIQPDRSKVCPEYLNYVFSTDALHAYMNMLATGATVGHLNVGDIRKLSLPEFPSIENQEKIAAILTAYDDLIENNRQRIALLEKMAEEIYREWFVRLRFPGHEHTPVHKGVPSGWEPKRIGEVVQFKSGFPFKSSTYEPNGKFGVVTIKNVHDGKFNPNCSDRVPAAPSKLPKHCYLNDGDILMSLTGNVGRVCQVIGEDLLLNQRVALLKAAKAEHSDFIYWAFRQKSMLTFCELISTGAAQQNLSPIKLAQQTLIYPPDNIVEKFQSNVEPMISQVITLQKSTSLLGKSRDLLLNRLISGKLRVDDLDIQFPPGMQEKVA